jgi:hypothetical protein
MLHSRLSWQLKIFYEQSFVKEFYLADPIFFLLRFHFIDNEDGKLGPWIRSQIVETKKFENLRRQTGRLSFVQWLEKQEGTDEVGEVCRTL